MVDLIASAGGAAGAPVGGDHFGPTIVVGNTLAGDPAAANAAPFQYIGDPGDGSGIVTAFAAAAAAGQHWVHIRRGTYTLTAAITVPLAIDGFRVTGDGCSTLIVVRTDDRRLFTLTTVGGVTGRPPELANLGISLPTAAVGATGIDLIDASTAIRASIENVEILSVAGPIDDPNESLTTLFRVGLLNRISNIRGVNINGNSGAVVLCRIVSLFTSVRDSFFGGSDIGVRVEAGAGFGSILACTFNGAAIVGTGIEVAADGVVVSANMLTSLTDGVVVLSGGGAQVAANIFTSGIPGDPIRVELGSIDTIVTANRLSGGTIVNLEPTTEIAHNI